MSIVVLLVVSGATLSALSTYQQLFTSVQMKADMHSGLRGTTELISQEVGQAGLLNYAGTTLSAAVTGSGTAQTVNLASTSGIFVGEKLLIDAGATQETVAVTAVTSTSVTGIFTASHANGAIVEAVGVFPQGILSTSTATQLQLVGDINGDGSLVYVQYDCNTAAGTLSRSNTPIASAHINASQIVLQGLVANPGSPATPCFQYTTATAGGYTFVTSVAMTLTAETAEVDQQTGQYAKVTKSFDNLSSRNILSGLAMAQATGWTSHLQSTPPGLPLS